MSEPPERDPLADLVSRSLGARVEAVDVEALAAPEGTERKRLRFATSAGATTAIFERARRGETLEAQLLPFLARKTDRVPTVHSRGLPPPHASLGPWLLMEDVLESPVGCDGDPVEILRAKIAIERAVTRDVPALRALGLRERPADDAALASAPFGLVHGALVCAATRRVARGVVIVDWSHAFLGPTILDAVSLARDLERHADTPGALRVRDAYLSEAEGAASKETWDAAYLKFP